MEERVLIFEKNCLNKNFFHKHKNLTDRIALFCKDSYGKKDSFKYLIGYIINSVKSLCIKIPQMNGYVNCFDSNNKYMNFLIHDKELLKNTMQYGIKLVIY